MKQLEVTGQDEKQRLDKYLKRIFPQMGTSFLYKMLRKKNITLNGKKATGSEQILAGDLIQCFFSEETFDKFAGNVRMDNPAADVCKTEMKNNGHGINVSDGNVVAYKEAYHSIKGIGVIYEDEHLLLLNKPAGILTQKAEKKDLSLNEWMIGYLLEEQKLAEDSLKRFKPSVCNRLDRNTSGLVICGKTLVGSRIMSQLLKERTLQKYYRTYVHGKLEGEKTLTAYHKKDGQKNQVEIIFSLPKKKGSLDDSKKIEKEYDTITTAYRSIKAKDTYSYLEIDLLTGKTHQIRAHLSTIGHPIVGDPKYGFYANKNFTEKMATKQPPKGYPKQQLLHAYRIVFPKMEEELAYLSGKEFLAPEPESFERFRGWIQDKESFTIDDIEM